MCSEGVQLDHKVVIETVSVGLQGRDSEGQSPRGAIASAQQERAASDSDLLPSVGNRSDAEVAEKIDLSEEETCINQASLSNQCDINVTKCSGV